MRISQRHTPRRRMPVEVALDAHDSACH
jgi:hypothetical protein